MSSTDFSLGLHKSDPAFKFDFNSLIDYKIDPIILHISL